MSLLLGVASIGAALGIVLFVLLGRVRGRGDAALARAVNFYSGRERPETIAATAEPVDIKDRVLALVDRLPKPDGYDARIDRRLERGAWPLRATEYLTIRACAALGCTFVAFVVTQKAWFAILCGAAGWFIPRVVLQRRIAARNNAFNEQLPDTLQLLAASLEAGYAVLQGLETIVREAPSPTAEEFARTVAEVRLGVPMHDALESMANRIGSDDFRWVIMSMNIQREVGGNLVQILHTVSDTVRERGRLGRTISALSAEGRLSAIILSVMPFALGVYLALVSPTYIGALLGSGLGRAFVIVALVLMSAGILWMRKIIKIEV